MLSQLIKDSDYNEDVELQPIPPTMVATFDGILDRVVRLYYPDKSRAKFSVQETWIELDCVAMSYAYQHCLECAEETNVFRFPVSILDSNNLAEQLDIFFIELNADIEDKNRKTVHYFEISQLRNDVIKMHELMEMYPEYIDLNKELPDLPNLENFHAYYQSDLTSVEFDNLHRRKEWL